MFLNGEKTNFFFKQILNFEASLPQAPRAEMWSLSISPTAPWTGCLDSVLHSTDKCLLTKTAQNDFRVL